MSETIQAGYVIIRTVHKAHFVDIILIINEYIAYLNIYS